MIERARRTGSSFALAAALARTGLTVLRATAPGGRERWERKNHAGRTVDLYTGPACAVAAAVGAARVRPAAGFAVLAAGACGAYDDEMGAEGPRRGFRAHLAALRNGEVTSGAVKLLGISAAGLAVGAVMKERPLDKVLAGVVVAGAAHFVNLVDVRPGRAGASVLALGGPGPPRPHCPTTSPSARCSGTREHTHRARPWASRWWPGTAGRDSPRTRWHSWPRRCTGRR
ncbi:hypothetical protein GCM10022384_33570 [Streptomyces marokkonensis]|uniref:Uncharacterized protein n=1 Tax=Streptomyces marokkonensis TaxID=324855 RepID=A0ABP7QFM3_9ACTN